jgi:predicted Zn-ribbon and HTH transcriptional regulator
MGRVPITVMGYKCERCGYEWIPRDDKREPKVCPKCKSPYWNSPKKQTQMSYEEFCDQIKTVLISSNKPMTWTEIRTLAKLPQKWPNNQWVHRMEKAIKLIREKDKNGIIHWKILST